MQENIGVLIANLKNALGITAEMFQELNDRIWDEKYLPGYYLEAQTLAALLAGYLPAYIREAWHGDVSGYIMATLAWSHYREDRNQRRSSGQSYRIAIGVLEDVQDHATRSRLFEVAGLCQAYLVEEQDEPAEPLLRRSVEEAELSGIPSRIGEAKNGLATLYLAPKYMDVERAIPLFVEVASIQIAAGNYAGAGNAYSNLIVCYNAKEDFAIAVATAFRATQCYAANYLSEHAYTARFRGTLALRGLGRLTRRRECFELAIIMYRQHIAWRQEADQDELVAREEQNIAQTQQEMAELGL